MKKLTSVILSALIAASALNFTGCTDKNNNNTSNISSISSVADTSGESSDSESALQESEEISLLNEYQYTVLNKDSIGSAFNNAEYIRKDDNTVFTIEHNSLKQTDRKTELQKRTATFSYEDTKYELTYDWFELDGKVYIVNEKSTSDNRIYISTDTGANDKIAYITAGDKNYYFVISVKTGEIKDIFAQQNEDYNIRSIIISADADKFIITYDTENSSYRSVYFDGSETVDLLNVCIPEANPDDYMYSAFFADGKIVVNLCKDGTNDVVLYDIETNDAEQILSSISVHEYLRLTINQRYGSYNKSETLYIIDLFTGESISTDIRYADAYFISQVGSSYFLVTYEDGRRVLLDASTGKPICEAKVAMADAESGNIITSSDGEIYFALADSSHNIHIYKFDKIDEA